MMTYSGNCYCAYCSSELGSADKFCGECGTIVEAHDVSRPDSSLPSPHLETVEKAKGGTFKTRFLTQRKMLLILILIPGLLFSILIILFNVIPDTFVDALAISRDGQILASGGSNGMVMVWQLPEMELLTEIQGGAPVVSLTFNRKGNLLVVGTSELVRGYDVSTGMAHEVFVDAFEGIAALCVDDSFTYGMDSRGQLNTWNWEKSWKGEETADDLQEKVRSSLSGYGFINQAMFSPDCSKLAISQYRGQIDLYDVKEDCQAGEKCLTGTGSLTPALSAAEEPEALAFSADGTKLGVLNDYNVLLWDYDEQSLLKTTKLSTMLGDVPLVMDLLLQHLIVGWGNGSIEFLDMESGKSTAIYYHGPAWYRFLRTALYGGKVF